jgi:hypothetical protein
MPATKKSTASAKTTSTKRTAASKGTASRSTAGAKKAAGAKKPVAVKKSTAKAATSRRGTARGSAYECEVCGLGVVVDELTGDSALYEFVCCDQPMKSRKQTAGAKA